MTHKYLDEITDPLNPVQKPPRAMRKILLPILMGAVAILGLTYSTFLAGQYISGGNIPITNSRSQITRTTNDLKLYTNEEYNFSLQYPHTWVEDPIGQDKQALEFGGYLISFGKKKIQLSLDGNSKGRDELGYYITVGIDPKTEDLLLELESEQRILKEPNMGVEIIEGELSGFKTIRFKNKSAGFYNDRFMIFRNNDIVSINLQYLADDLDTKQQGQKDYDKILSSFKFTN